MEDNVAQDKRYQDCEHTQVAPVLPSDDLARGNRRKRGQKAHVDDGCNKAADSCRQQNRRAASEPKQRKPGEWPSADRQATGPVGNCRKEKARNARRNITVEHFVDVPIERGQMRRHDELAHVLGHPKEDTDRRPQARPQKERTETVGKQSGAVIVAAALQGGGCRHRQTLLHLAQAL